MAYVSAQDSLGLRQGALKLSGRSAFLCHDASTHKRQRESQQACFANFGTWRSGALSVGRQNIEGTR